MSYNIENLSLKSLEKMFLVLDDIRYNMEIQNKTSWLDMGRVAGVKGVPKSEHGRIMQSLLENTDFLGEIYYGGSNCCLDIKVEKFNQFLQKISDRINKLKSEQTIKKAQEKIKVKSYDEENKILTIGNFKIKIAKNEGNNNAHEIMTHIFIDNKDNLRGKFDYSVIAEKRFGANYKASDKYAQQPYSGACQRINQIIKDETNGNVKDFLIYNHSKLGDVRVNPNYL